MKFLPFAAVAAATLAAMPAHAAIFTASNDAGSGPCNIATNNTAFATGEVLTYSAQSCLGGYSVFLDTTAKTITLVSAEAPFADYIFSSLTITGITETVITSLSTIQYEPLFQNARPIPVPQLSFTADSITILFGSDESGSPVFDFSLGGGEAIFAYNSGAVPEPASWAMMIAGFGLVGAAMRRRALATA